ncbi:MAG: ABC transporter permease, partial [Candidatus Thorarchaeota archaeon]
SISFSGIWVLEKIAAEEEFTVADGRWTAVNPQIAAFNMSAYVFNRIKLPAKYNGLALTLEVKFFLSEGRILEIYNPMHEARSFDFRLQVDPLFSNFVEYRDMNLAIAPSQGPLIINLSLSYLEFLLMTHVSLDPGERDFVDLTPPFIRSMALAQANILTEMLDALEPYGFKLTNLYRKLGRVSDLYELAAQNFEVQDSDSAMSNLVTARNLYRDAYLETMNAYSGTFGWTPTLVVVLVFFSFAVSRMLTENRLMGNIGFAILLPLVLTLFIPTQPGLRLFIFNLGFLVEKLTAPFFLSFLLQFVQIAIVVIIVVVSMFTDLRNLASQVFGVSMKNLRRRKMKTTLALSTIIVVSASAMCLLTFASVEPTHRVPVSGFSPRVSSGLVVYRQMAVTTKPDATSGDVLTRTVYYEPFKAHEISWFSKDWVDSMSVYGVETVRLHTLEGLTISDFSIFNLVATDPYFMERYLDASEVLGAPCIEPKDTNVVLIGSEIASRYNLTAGSALLLGNRRFTVKGVFEEQRAIEDLKDLDGSPFLFQVVDPVTKEITGGSFIIGSTNDFPLGELRIYKISIVTDKEHSQNATLFVDEILPAGLDFWETDAASFVSSYLVHVISDGSITAVYSGGPVVNLWGNWQVHIAPIAITALLLVTNALGTIAERKPEIHTIFTMGASPTRIRFIILAEGLVLGIMGGIFGYVFGYAFAQVTGSALPSMVQENMIGGGPFAISFSVATIASLLGYLLPPGLAVKSAVPSGRLSKTMKDIIEVKRGEVNLVVPMKLQLGEMRVFDDFLKDLVKGYSSTMYSKIDMSQLASKRFGGEETWVFDIRCASGHVSNYQVSILARPNTDLQVLLSPLDVMERKLTRWTLEHRHNLKRTCLILRDELLKFITFKKK